MGNPMKIRAANKDGVTEVKVLVSHEMETGQRKDSAGAIVPAWFITELVAKHGDKTVLSCEFGPSVSKNPYLAFKFKGGAKGDKVIGQLEGQQGRHPHRRSRHRLSSSTLYHGSEGGTDRRCRHITSPGGVPVWFNAC
jgi:sulfur-oxidizing protein SoxZ